MRIFNKALFFGIILTFLLHAADPPPEVDSALRARVQNFYQLQTDRKYRQAEQFVAEDTKDLYYAGNKPQIQSFRITGIQYGADFQTAKVSVSAHMQVMMPGLTPPVMNFDVPLTGTWKIENGLWCWYVDQSKPVETPFGPIPRSTTEGKPDSSKLAEAVSAASLMAGVHADKAGIRLDPRQPKPEILTLQNTLPGPVTVQSLTTSAALKIEITKPNLGAKESTEVTITPVPGSADRPKEIQFRIGPLNQIIRIAVEYTDTK